MKGVYKITNMVNKKVYIGQTDRLNEREREHFYRLERNEHHNQFLQKSYNKYGKENFIFEVLEESDNLNECELRWINSYGGINSELNYNLKDPTSKEWSNYVKVKQSKTMLGENNPNYGNKWSEEQKEKLSKIKKGKTLEDRIGKERAELAKQKMSNSQKGRKHSEEVKEKIRQYNIGEKNPSYGKGERQKGEKNPMFGKPAPNRKKILKIDNDGNIIKEYESATQVKEDGFNIGNVCNCANGVKGYKKSKGYFWKWKP